jgi:hypothetical protein
MSMSSTTTAATTTGSSPGDEGSAVQHGAQAVKEHAGTAAATAKDEAVSVVHSATDHARSLLGSAGDEFREQGRSQAERLGEMLGQAAKEFGRMAQECDTTTPAGRTVKTLADATGQLAHRLDQGGPEGMMSDVSRFARRRPGTFLALSAAAGFAVGRLARSTDTQAIKDAVQPPGSNGQRSSATNDTVAATPAPASDAALGEADGADFVGEVASTPVGAETVPVPPRTGGPAAGGGAR